MKTKIKRKFLGKLEVKTNYTSPLTIQSSKMERHYNDRMLRAYLKGQSFFNRGQFKVLQSYN